MAWGVCLFGWLIVSQVPSRYESRAKVFVQMQSLLPDAAGQGAQQKSVDQIRQTLVSAVNLQKVVRGTELAQTVANDRDVADRAAGLAQSIKLVTTQDNLFEITTSAATPRLAQSITQKLIDIFEEQNLADDRTANAQSLRFLDKQLADRQEQLREAEASAPISRTIIWSACPARAVSPIASARRGRRSPRSTATLRRHRPALLPFRVR